MFPMVARQSINEMQLPPSSLCHCEAVEATRTISLFYNNAKLYIYIYIYFYSYSCLFKLSKCLHCKKEKGTQRSFSHLKIGRATLKKVADLIPATSWCEPLLVRMLLAR